MHKAAIAVAVIGLLIILAAVFAVIRRAWVNKQLNSAAKVYQQAQQQAKQAGQGAYTNVRGEARKVEEFAGDVNQAAGDFKKKL